MNKTRLILIAGLILVSLAAFAGKGADKKNDKGLEHRVTALEESREFLFRRDGLPGSPDCGLFYHFETPFWDAPEYIGQGKDTFPPSFSGDYSGNLTALVVPETDEVDACDSASIPAATSPTDIVAIKRGDCPFLTKSQNAADRGYGAVLIVNHKVEDSPFFDVNPKTVTRMSSPDGVTPFPIPTMMTNWNEAFFHLSIALAEDPVPIFIEGTTFCSPLNAGLFLTE